MGDMEMPKKRVAISGWMATGKSTCSEHLISRYGYKRISFAQPIKLIVEQWFQFYSLANLNPDDKVKAEHSLFYILVDVFDEDYTKASKAMDILLEDVFPRYMDIDWSVEKNDKWRRCLQEVGGGRIRTEIDNNVWVNYAMRKLEPDGLYICDDLRYQNEYDILGNNGFTLIRLNISPEEQWKRITRLYGEIDPERLKHPSETDLDDVQFPNMIDADQPLTSVLHDLVSIVEGDDNE